ncbi:hypothetical protein DCC85_05660 [Paenibacillus sp. CAA11]|uniref:ABC transporter permease n=1 Tax=Paenibacillus sp. CAA11 TaxID=1532905 RepID=UPI000D3A9465|nr:ABC transporter permease [Paenibacillus sp. CAA11]AWB43757.1 hypothetical protein DCC85_05660 [Paenibacillus sp. CAA11]
MQTLYLIGKQLKLMLNNRLAFLMIIAAPLLLTYLFTSAEQNGTVKLYAADADQSKASRQLIQQLEQYSELKLTLLDSDKLEAAVEKDPRACALNIQAGFARSLQFGGEAKVEIWQNEGSSLGAKIRPYIEKEMAYLRGAGSKSDLIQASEDDHAGHAHQAAGQRLNAFMVMFLWFVVMQSFRTLVDERENGLTARLLGLPISYTRYLLSKLVSAYLFGLLNIGVVMLAGYWLFHIEFTNSIGVAIFVWSAYLLALCGIVMLLVPRVRSHQNFTVLGSALMAVAGLLGGSFFPIDSSAPEWIQAISRVIPGYWALRSINKTNVTAGSEVSNTICILVLAAIGIAAICLSLWSIRHRLQAQKSI